MFLPWVASACSCERAEPLQASKWSHWCCLPHSGATKKKKKRKNKPKKKSRKGKIAGEASESTGLYFLRAARETKLALGAAPFMKERRWVEHNLPSSSWLGIKEQI